MARVNAQGPDTLQQTGSRPTRKNPLADWGRAIHSERTGQCECSDNYAASFNGLAYSSGSAYGCYIVWRADLFGAQRFMLSVLHLKPDRRLQVGQDNAQIELPELKMNPPQPMLQLNIAVHIERGGAP